ncbi:glycine cleavage system aminomethyltransferase GcvT [Virgibacillus alimentarius]|uniref:Aminomethyltransferase n=1 Tax=Virgibacillus alimentarius TaxID=698769 RepID=A0ABS4S523_9BACI|nr:MULTISPECIES: glycine cleavage system aminomethyltransferase GcvT [Virgibacillus]MBP2256494.1 aminomethyltransferase [Virgibacillus alimentarius]HLR66439.1 glycine cleavage system aminomethyltransferase GcvT [Virgibacillus sp.]
MSELKRTPLYPEYEKSGAKTIDFGGWDLPVQFSGIKHEHNVTRTKAGLFDVSHMGEIAIKGPKSLDFLQKVVTNDVSKLVPKRAQYTFMCYEDGGTVDDFLIYMLEENNYLLVVNAANTEKDYDWLIKQNNYNNDELIIEDVSKNYVQLALQGPKAEEILQTLTDTNLSEIKFFRFENPVYFSSLEAGAIVSRTGYTGEDGFEIYIDQHSGRDFWNLILQAGKDKGLEPIGLGARDTLRFEVNLPLYGQELSRDISPIEAGLKFAVKVNKPVDFIGKEALKKQIEEGTNRKLIGIEMIDKGIPRTGYEVYYNNEKIGYITSGTQSPSLQKNIGLALVNSEFTEEGTELVVQVRKRKLKAVVIKTPFYKK